jgi:hypothetical protein
MQWWPVAMEQGYLRAIIHNEDTLDYWTATFQTVYEGKIDTWDYQWTFACWLNHMLAVLPQVNLVTNIGFGGEATHTREPSSEAAEKPSSSMVFPLVHPPFVVRHESADEYTDEQHFHLPGRTNAYHANCALCKLRDRYSSIWSKIYTVGQLIWNRKFRFLFSKISARLKLVISSKPQRN